MVRMNFQVDSPAAWAAEYHNCTLLDRNISVEKTLFESADATCQLLRSCSKETLPKLCESIRENGLGGRTVWLYGEYEHLPPLLPPQGILKVLTCLKDVGHAACTMPTAWRHDSTGILHLQKHAAEVPVKFLVAQLEAMEETKGLAWLQAMNITSESQCGESKDGPALFDQELAKTAWEVGQITALPKVLRILGRWKLGMPQILLDALMASRRLELMQLRELTRQPSLSDTFSAVKALNAALDDASELCFSILALNLAENLTNLTMNCFRCNDFAKVPSAKDWNDLSSQVAKIQHLSLEHFSVTDLGMVAHQAKSLKSLTFANDQLTELPKEVFSGLSNLETLYLRYNKLTKLPKEVFRGLSTLETLHLYGNQLTDLPKEVFSGLAHLKVLDLGGNKLAKLRKEVFSGLSNLEKLNLGGNQLTELPKEVFSGLSNLKTLHLGGNQLTELPKEVFSGLSNLKTLRLDRNQLTELPKEVFRGLAHLTHLDLGGNKLTEDDIPGFSNLRAWGVRIRI